MSNDFISRYVETVSRYCDAPEIFIRASAYHIVSSLLGRFFWCPFMPGPRQPNANLWFIISSIPGRMRRSSVQWYAKYVYQKVLFEYLKETYKESVEESALEEEELFAEEEREGEEEQKRKKKVKRELSPEEKEERRINRIKRMILQSIIEEGTPEGILDRIGTSKLPTYVIESPEFGGVMARFASRDYESGTLSLLSKMYYGEGGSMLLSTRGGGKGERILPEGLYVTMLAGMQEPEYYLTPSMVRQGTLRRMLICFYDPKEEDKNRWQEPLRIGREMIFEELDVFAEELVKLMIKYHGIVESRGSLIPWINIHMLPSVMNNINVFAKECDNAVIDLPDNVNIYRQSLWEMLAKLSMNEAIAEGKLVKLTGEEVVNVSSDNFLKAKQFLEKVMVNIDGVISRLGEEKEPITTAEAPLDRIYRFILQGGSSGITRQDLYKKAKMTADRLDKYIETLLAQGMIKTKLGRTQKTNVPYIYYVASKFEEEAVL